VSYFILKGRNLCFRLYFFLNKHKHWKNDLFSLVIFLILIQNNVSDTILFPSSSKNPRFCSQMIQVVLYPEMETSSVKWAQVSMLSPEGRDVVYLRNVVLNKN
jgi:hypothetical protein